MPLELPVPKTVSLRPIVPEDEAFLFALYASTREEELKIVPWTAEQKQAFLQMQFRAQHHFYQEQYVGSTFDVILVGEVPAGRLYVARWRDEMRIIDIAFLPAWRGHGIGSRLLRTLQDEAAAAHKSLTIHVERMNPALRLYERLGFTLREDKGVYLFLEWRPPERPA
jgi:ribosomal protein S18 acetylase RimI-like enzyme